jgi:hypothetical protein
VPEIPFEGLFGGHDKEPPTVFDVAVNVPLHVPVATFALLTGRQPGSDVENEPLEEMGPAMGNETPTPKHSFPVLSTIVEEKLPVPSTVPVQVPEHVPGGVPLL